MSTGRRTWVSYLRVSTPDQAERELSLPAQRHAVNAYAAQHGLALAGEYVEEGASGTSANRPVFRRMLDAVHSPGSDICGILVHHTSRFTRDATLARVLKGKLRKAGVRVVSVSQETHDDPVGQLIEGVFECIDQYESEMNGMRTAAAMRESVRQGYFPGAAPPFGYRVEKVTLRPGVERGVLVVDGTEAAVVREVFQRYVADNGAKSVARSLNRDGIRYRHDRPWSRELVLKVLDEPAVAGTYYWGKHEPRTHRRRARSEWLALPVPAIVDPRVHEVVTALRSQRKPERRPGRVAAPTHVLSGLIHCARCGASYQLETSGKRVGDEVYRYRYYNCRTACRIGREACPGFRIPAEVLDRAVLEHLAEVICAEARCHAVAAERGADPGTFRRSWTSLVLAGGAVSRSYLRHLVDRIDVGQNEIAIRGRRAPQSTG